MRSEISFRYKHRAFFFFFFFSFWHLTFSCNFRGQSWTGVLQDAILMGLKQTSEYTENNVRKRAQSWVFRISRSLRYISDFLVLKLAIDGNFPGHSFSSFISFPFFLGLPLFQSLQRYLIYHVDRCLWLTYEVLCCQHGMVHGEQHMNKFYLLSSMWIWIYT